MEGVEQIVMCVSLVKIAKHASRDFTVVLVESVIYLTATCAALKRALNAYLDLN